MIMVRKECRREMGSLLCLSADSPLPYLCSLLPSCSVHFQNSALLVDALINLDLPLSIFYFPNRAHSLTQWKTGLPPKYLYEKLLQILTGGNGPNGNGALANA
jgi:hypothetical protein